MNQATQQKTHRSQLSSGEWQALGREAARREFLPLATAIKALWDKHGIGDNENESEPIYQALCEFLGEKGAG